MATTAVWFERPWVHRDTPQQKRRAPNGSRKNVSRLLCQRCGRKRLHPQRYTKIAKSLGLCGGWQREAKCDPCLAVRPKKAARRDGTLAIKCSLRRRALHPSVAGCSTEKVKAHIEAQFLPGMTWENRSPHGWHLDHIRPLASFDLTDPEQRAAAGHWTNLQPLWARDNLVKSARWIDIASLF